MDSKNVYQYPTLSSDQRVKDLLQSIEMYQKQLDKVIEDIQKSCEHDFESGKRYEICKHCGCLAPKD